MKPYYQHHDIQIYHGNSHELVPQLNVDIQLVLTDPPYGIQLNTDYRSYSDSPNIATCAKGRSDLRKSHPALIGDNIPFNPSWLLHYPELMLWGANNFTEHLPMGSWLVWDKRAHNGNAFKSDGELAWWNHGQMIHIFNHCWQGFSRASESRQHHHPTQKPEALMRWCLSLSKSTGMILDPYMGTGPVLRAAQAYQRPVIGIEIDEHYCECAARQLEQEILLFQ